MNQETQASVQTETANAPDRRQELKFAGKWAFRAVLAAIILGILIYLTHFFSGLLTLLVTAIGVIIILASLTYALGHFVRFLAFGNRRS